MINNFDRAKIGYDKMDAHDKQIWNEAIEAAALRAERSFQYKTHIAASIRRLKK